MSTADCLPKVAPDQAGALYLDLMKRCLTDSIFMDDPFAQMRPLDDQTVRGWRSVLLAVSRAALRPIGIEFAQRYRYPGAADYEKRSISEIAERRANGLDWPMRAHTMIGLRRLENLQHCVETALRDAVPGDLIETGVWRGGACIFMRAILKAHGDTDRTVWVADSFAGLPLPAAEHFEADRHAVWHTYRDLAIPRAAVMANFQRYGLLDRQVRFLEGWFKDTLPNAPIDRLAVLRLDGDMYESTMQALDALYGKVSPGGFVIVDDYHAVPACRQAVDDFRAARAINHEILEIDGSGAYWRLPIASEGAPAA